MLLFQSRALSPAHTEKHKESKHAVQVVTQENVKFDDTLQRISSGPNNEIVILSYDGNTIHIVDPDTYVGKKLQISETSPEVSPHDRRFSPAYDQWVSAFLLSDEVLLLHNRIRNVITVINPRLCVKNKIFHASMQKAPEGLMLTSHPCLRQTEFVSKFSRETIGLFKLTEEGLTCLDTLSGLYPSVTSIGSNQYVAIRQDHTKLADGRHQFKFYIDLFSKNKEDKLEVTQSTLCDSLIDYFLTKFYSVLALPDACIVLYSLAKTVLICDTKTNHMIQYDIPFDDYLYLGTDPNSSSLIGICNRKDKIFTLNVKTGEFHFADIPILHDLTITSSGKIAVYRKSGAHILNNVADLQERYMKSLKNYSIKTLVATAPTIRMGESAASESEESKENAAYATRRPM